MRVLMSPPTYFEILWEINPWMSRKNQPNKELAKKQWGNLLRIFKKLKLNVLLIPPQKGLPDMVFTANAGWGINKKFLISNFKAKERKPEEKFYLKYFHSQNFKIFTLPKNLYFEGGADIITTKENYLFGYGQRSDFETINYLKNFLKLRKPVVPLKLIDKRFFHLDTCFLYLKPINTIFYFPAAFSQESIEKIKNLSPEKVEVSEKEAKDFTLNSVYYNKSVILSCDSPRIKRILKSKGLKTIFADVSEFKKAGGGIKCLTLFLD